MIKPVKSLFALVSFVLVLGMQSAQASTDMIIEVESPLGFDETIAKIKENAKALGWKAASLDRLSACPTLRSHQSPASSRPAEPDRTAVP